MITRHYPYHGHRRRFKENWRKSAPTYAIAEIERLERENLRLREALSDIRCMVFDFPIYRTHVSQYVKLVVLLRGLVKS